MQDLWVNAASLVSISDSSRWFGFPVGPHFRFPPAMGCVNWQHRRVWLGTHAPVIIIKFSVSHQHLISSRIHIKISSGIFYRKCSRLATQARIPTWQTSAGPSSLLSPDRVWLTSLPHSSLLPNATHQTCCPHLSCPLTLASLISVCRMGL